MTINLPGSPSCPTWARQAGKAAPLVLIAVVLVACAAFMLASRQRSPHGQGEPAPVVVPVAFSNTGSAIAYVGSEACRSCHAEAFASHARTAHAQSFGSIDLTAGGLAGGSSDGGGSDAGGLEGSFHHRASGLTLEMSAEDGRLQVREFLPGAGEGETIQSHALDYFLGSGRHWRSHVSMLDGLAVPAPVALFPEHAAPDAPASGHATQKGGWGIVPGQERADRGSFDQVLSPECLRCHVGRLETGGGESGRVRILENAIGCENCHGAGALHVERWAVASPAAVSAALATSQGDDTIASPARMTAAQSMDVCNRCHLFGRFTVPVEGRDISDWRPGLMLGSYRLRFGEKDRPDDPSRRAPVDRLKASACFQGSSGMTCLTCHGIHDPASEKDRVAYFRAKCIACHSDATEGEKACGLPAPERLKVNARDDCVQCHMRSGEPYRLHEPVHDHRIAVLSGKSGPLRRERRTPELEALDDLSGLSQIQLDRTLGYANLVLSWVPGRPLEERDALVDRALVHFEAVRDALVGGHQPGTPKVSDDPIVEGGLASIYTQRKQKATALRAAQAAADSEKPAPRDVRVSALRMASHLFMFYGQYAEALPYLERLTRTRRDAGDWQRIGTCARELGDKERALRAAEKMLEISPQRPEVQWGAAELLRWLGLTERGEHHAQLGQRLESAKRRR